MSRVMRVLVAIGACTVLMLAMGADAAKPAEPYEGKEWLAWTPAERNVYVRGFMEGFWGASHDACRLADDLFEVGKPHRLGQEPSGRCQVRLENYSKMRILDSGPDFSVYTTVITEFYTKHPEYQNIPKAHILSYLTDRKFKTADQLYQMALKGEIPTHF